MYLHKLELNLQSREARRDLSDPYELHSTLCRAFSVPEIKCPPGSLLWRAEPAAHPIRPPVILVQSRAVGDWSRIRHTWITTVSPPANLQDKLQLDALQAGQHFRFRLRANPSVSHNGKRRGLLTTQSQYHWLIRKGQVHGFTLPGRHTFDPTQATSVYPNVTISQPRILTGAQRSGNVMTIFSVLYDGVLTVTDPERFRQALANGIGHGKVLGLGLLSIAPLGTQTKLNDR